MRLALAVIFCFFVRTLSAQTPTYQSTADLYQRIQSFNFLGHVVYIAAHPDDENTRLISYLTHEKHAQVTYISMTRGGGGQNLIGTELSDALGILRTRELQAARSIDRGSQKFTSARDFGFSKHPDEALEIWGTAAMVDELSQHLIEEPADIVIHRFDHRTPGTTHGQHTASAMLSMLALEKIQGIAPAKSPRRVFFNTSPWFFSNLEEVADTKRFMSIETGIYYPELGMANGEIAALATSQHRCQGFGRLGVREEQKEYLELIQGSMPEKDQLFSGINTTWSRVPGGDKVGTIVSKITEDFDFKNPKNHVPDLIQAYKLLEGLPNSYWKQKKLPELAQLIMDFQGVYLGAHTQKRETAPGEKLDFTLDINLQNPVVQPQEIEIRFQNELLFKTTLTNQAKNFKVPLELIFDKNTPYTTPYWLENPVLEGRYQIDEKYPLGAPWVTQGTDLNMTWKVDGIELKKSIPITYRYADPSLGERVEPLQVLPKTKVDFVESLGIWTPNSTRKVSVSLTGSGDVAPGTLTLNLPSGWTATPNQIVNAQQGIHEFMVTSSGDPFSGSIGVGLTAGQTVFNQSVQYIAYEHIPTTAWVKKAQMRAVNATLAHTGGVVGYLPGAGDKIPEAITSLGYELKLLQPDEINQNSLQQCKAIVVGIRAFNVYNNSQQLIDELLAYAKQGGNVLVQYNTTADLKSAQLGPYPLTIGRDRVTDQNAEVLFSKPNHPMLHHPNPLTPDDFQGWIQERGLYFPSQWDKNWESLLQMKDRDTGLLESALLVAQYGKGRWTYTGLSLFRQLPYGVPGALKLFVNLIEQ